MTYSLYDKPITTTHYIMDTSQDFPRIRDLPPEEQKPFRAFLCGQTIPWLSGVLREEQDGYYPWDYENFKRKPKDRFFD